MEKAEIIALLVAHRGRAQVVASLHLLRDGALGEPAHAFLAEHEAALATIDLQRWLSRASTAQRPAVEAAMARLAEREPARFEHEIRRAPPAAPEPPFPGLTETLSDGEGFFDPGDLLGDLDFDSEAPAADRHSPPGLAGSSHPELDALLAGLAGATGPKARSAWKARSLAAAADTAESWAAAVLHLPPAMRDAVLARAAVSPRSEERAALLEWLFQNGAKRPKLVELTLSLLGTGPAVVHVGSWLAETWIPKLLPDKAAWSKHGPTLLAAFLEYGHFSTLDELFTAVLTGATALGPGLLGMTGANGDALRGPVIAAFTKALVQRVADALAAGRRQEALGAAAALVSLGPPSREVPGVRSLRRKRSAKGEVATLLALAERRARGPKQAPRLEDLITTVHVLSDALA